MKKSLALLACLALPLAALAATPAANTPAAAASGVKTAHHDAARPAPAASAASGAARDGAQPGRLAELRAAKERGSVMSACQKQAADLKLQDVERKQFLTTCVHAG